ncbi:Vmc-like lipoprotein signal peptide domain-containing protein [Ureaplasma canigenitalium]|uniref:Vmc-like lipoprotein signal peptide domain-containing protein n=1 Tax=Ureaplasma canigenitalium TaxID=42092 RepID=UPI0004E25128|nr:hypothetical protein [Ureaplasma canigenitalium]
MKKNQMRKYLGLGLGLLTVLGSIAIVAVACNKQKGQKGSGELNKNKPLHDGGHDLQLTEQDHAKIINVPSPAEWFEKFKAQVSKPRPYVDKNIELKYDFKLPKSKQVEGDVLFKIGDKTIWDVEQKDIPIQKVEEILSVFQNPQLIPHLINDTNIFGSIKPEDLETGSDANKRKIKPFRFNTNLRQQGNPSFNLPLFHNVLFRRDFYTSDVYNYNIQHGIYQDIVYGRPLNDDNYRVRWNNVTLRNFRPLKGAILNFDKLLQELHVEKPSPKGPNSRELTPKKIKLIYQKEDDSSIKKEVVVQPVYLKERNQYFEAAIDLGIGTPKGVYNLDRVIDLDNDNKEYDFILDDLKKAYQIKIFGEDEPITPYPFFEWNVRILERYKGALFDPNLSLEFDEEQLRENQKHLNGKSYNFLPPLKFTKPYWLLDINDLDAALASALFVAKEDLNDYTREYVITNHNEKDHSFEVAVKFRNNKTKKEYESKKLILRYSNLSFENTTAELTFESFANVSTWNSKPQNKKKYEEVLKTLNFSNLTQEELSKIVTVTFSDTDFQYHATPRVKISVDAKKIITLKVYVSNKWVNGKPTYSQEADIPLKEFKLNLFNI